ncbi:hypothetical protein IWQ62_002037 [Dispira parvispora]|uniref:Dymeclin n=1 Tax=Dispira parvispora TaxID=1520584 RepID=A0A9W8AUQ4_9FUNG|nr:hypothetical protein IWQ62_002037 [Dispira parvispora]
MHPQERAPKVRVHVPSVADSLAAISISQPIDTVTPANPSPKVIGHASTDLEKTSTIVPEEMGHRSPESRSLRTLSTTVTPLQVERTDESTPHTKTSAELQPNVSLLLQPVSLPTTASDKVVSELQPPPHALSQASNPSPLPSTTPNTSPNVITSSPSRTTSKPHGMSPSKGTQSRPDTFTESDGSPTLRPRTLESLPTYYRNRTVTNPSPRTYRALSESELLGSSEQSFLRDLVSSEIYAVENYGFWESDLAALMFPAAKTHAEYRELHLVTQGLADELWLHNRHTGNFNTLILHFLIHIKHLDIRHYDSPVSQVVTNALFVLNLFLGHLVERYPARQVDDLVNDHRLHVSSYQRFIARLGQQDEGSLWVQAANKVLADQRPRSEQLVECALVALTQLDLACQPTHFPFYRGMLEFLITLYTPQLWGDRFTLSLETLEPSPFLVLTVTKLGHCAFPLVQRLLANFIHPILSCPTTASTMYQAYSYLFNSNKLQQTQQARDLADVGMLLGLLLIYQPIIPYTSVKNGYVSEESDNRSISRPCSESDQPLLFQQVLNQGWENDTPKSLANVSYRSTLEWLFRNLESDVGVVVLYTLLTRSSHFTNYLLAQTDPDVFLVALLKVVYQHVDQANPDYDRLYLWLTVLVRLTRDDTFNQAFHRYPLTPPPWLHDRSLKALTLNQLVVWVAIRVLQSNLATHRDAFLHESSMAILVNFSPHICHLPAGMVQRVFKVFEMVARRYLKISGATIEGSPVPTSATALASLTPNAPNSESGNDVPPTTSTSVPEGMVCLDTVRLLVYIITNTLAHQLRTNTHLVYGLLQCKGLFATLQNDPLVKDWVKNANFIIAYFQACLQEKNLNSPSTDEVLRLIQEKIPLFHTNHIQIRRLWAHYQPVVTTLDPFRKPSGEFFGAYLWECLVKRCPRLPFDAEDTLLISTFRMEMD